MTNTPPRVSEKIETDAIEHILATETRLAKGDDYSVITWPISELERASAQLARLKAAAQEWDTVVEECAAICDEFARTTTHNILAAPVRVCAARIRARKSGVHRAESEEGCK